MDGFTLGILIRTLLQSAGLKATLAIVFVGGIIYAIYRAANAIGHFMERLIANRDAMLSQTLQRIADSDARRAAYEAETASILSGISVKMDGLEDDHRESRERLDKIREDVISIKGAVRGR